jgi:hypothetical protein
LITSLRKPARPVSVAFPTHSRRVNENSSPAFRKGIPSRSNPLTMNRGRAAVEREFGRLKNEYRLTPLRVRGIERVALHADLTMLASLSLALARARAIPLVA